MHIFAVSVLISDLLQIPTYVQGSVGFTRGMVVFQWHFIKYTWQHLARLLTGSLQQLPSAVSLIAGLSAIVFHPLRSRITNNGIGILCVLAVNMSTRMLCQTTRLPLTLGSSQINPRYTMLAFWAMEPHSLPPLIVNVCYFHLSTISNHDSWTAAHSHIWHQENDGYRQALVWTESIQLILRMIFTWYYNQMSC